MARCFFSSRSWLLIHWSIPLPWNRCQTHSSSSSCKTASFSFSEFWIRYMHSSMVKDTSFSCRSSTSSRLEVVKDRHRFPIVLMGSSLSSQVPICLCSPPLLLLILGSTPNAEISFMETKKLPQLHID